MLFLYICFIGIIAGQAKLLAEENGFLTQYITIDDGLAQSTVRTILQDSRGFMWFGTEDGLNRYDGYNFQVYYYEQNDSNTLCDNWINSIFEDKSGVIWIGTNNGLNRYNFSKNNFDRFMKQTADSTNLSDNEIQCFSEDSFGKIWIGTYNGGINIYDKRTNRFQQMSSKRQQAESLTDNRILTAYQDKKGSMWVGTSQGLNLFDREHNCFIHFKNDLPDINETKSNTIYSILEDKTGIFWIGTEDGLFIFDREKESFASSAAQYHFVKKLFVRAIIEDQLGDLWIGADDGTLFRINKKDSSFVPVKIHGSNLVGIQSGKIFSLFEDRSQILWIGTDAGIIKINRNPRKFRIFNQEMSAANGLSDNCIWSLCEDRLGNLWVGTDNRGLNYYDRKRDQFKIYEHESNNPHSLNNNCVLAVCEDYLGSIWAGTFGGGINVLNREEGKFTFFKHNPKDSSSIGANEITVIYEDRSRNLWIGTLTGTIGRFNRESRNFKNYRVRAPEADQFRNTEIRAIFEDHNGRLWIGVERLGLFTFDPDYDKFTLFQNEDSITNRLSNNSVMSLAEDRQGRIWIGTSGGGLNSFDPKTKKISHFRKKDGLPNETIYGILAEEPTKGKNMGCLWLSTNNGLSKFDLETETFVNYDIVDGLQSNEFNANAFCKSRTGEMFFGGINGLNSFFPSDIADDKFIPPVLITDFKLFHNLVPIGKNFNGRVILENSILETKTIELKYSENFFEIGIAALHLWAPQKNQYQYLMEGLDDNWHNIGSRNFVSFAQLRPGKYSFKVKGTNNDGIWNAEAATLQINIIPPIWQRDWFRLLGYLLLFTFIFSLHRMRFGYVKRKNLQLQEWNAKLEKQIIKRQKAEKKIAASLAEKEILLKEIHHRVKNNLQVVSSLLYLQSRNYQQSEILDIFLGSQNRIRAISLVHEALYQTTNFTKINFSRYLRDLLIHLNRIFKIDPSKINIKLDVDNVALDIDAAMSCGLIINELVSNALKHAFPKNKEGEIAITFHQSKKDNFELSVKDTGIGLPERSVLDNKKSLGLRLVETLVKQLSGNLSIERTNGTWYVINFKA
jgi:two-component sensor histidine kinase/ligand-binding sensor domain-containing protein